MSNPVLKLKNWWKKLTAKRCERCTTEKELSELSEDHYWDGKVRNGTYKLVLGGYGLGKEELVCTTHYLSAMEYQKWGHARSDRDYALGGFEI